MESYRRTAEWKTPFGRDLHTSQALGRSGPGVVKIPETSVGG
jgi:hypothetical protein